MASVLYTGFKDLSIGKIRGMLTGTSFFPIDLAVAKDSFLQNSDAILVGPESMDIILAVQQIFKINPQITVIVLCYNDVAATLKKEMIFKPFIGKYTKFYIFEDIDTNSILQDLSLSQQRRNYAKVKAGLGNIPLTNPAILPIEHLGTFLEQAPIGAILLDADYKIITTNRQAKSLLSLGKNPFTKISDLFDEIQQHEIRNLVENNSESNRIEIQLNLKFLSISIAKVVNELGDPFVILLINDITEQAIEKQRITKILDAMPQVGWLTDPCGSIVHLTESWFENIGQIHSDKNNWEDYILSEDRERVIKQWHNSLQTKEKFEQEVRFKMKVVSKNQPSPF